MTRHLTLLLLALPGLGFILLGMVRLGADFDDYRGRAVLASNANLADAENETAYRSALTLLAPRARLDAAAAVQFSFLKVQKALANLPRDAGLDTEALAALTDAVQLSPLEPRTWAGLALLLARADNSQSSASALGVSYLSYNVALPIKVVRAWAGIAGWPNLSGDLQDRVATDILDLWKDEAFRRDLLALSELDNGEAAFAAAFAGHPEAARWLSLARVKPR